MSYIKVDIKPLSINQLKKKYPDLFWDQDWYSKEKWVTSKPKAETLYIDPQADGSINKAWREQEGSLSINEFVPTANQLIQCLIQHYNETDERLLENSYSRTSDVSANGYRVVVGYFGSGGLIVSRWNDSPHSLVGVGVARKLENLETRSLDPSLNLELSEITINGRVYVPKELLK